MNEDELPLRYIRDCEIEPVPQYLSTSQSSIHSTTRNQGEMPGECSFLSVPQPVLAAWQLFIGLVQIQFTQHIYTYAHTHTHLLCWPVTWTCKVTALKHQIPTSNQCTGILRNLVVGRYLLVQIASIWSTYNSAIVASIGPGAKFSMTRETYQTPNNRASNYLSSFWLSFYLKYDIMD